ncbi:MAG: flavin prenyltransferase UbiX [bacterium]
MIKDELVVGITGASGIIYGVKFLELLLRTPARVRLIISPAGEEVLRSEIKLRTRTKGPLKPEAFLDLTDDQRKRIRLDRFDNLAAPTSSGSFRTAGMVVIPCSMRTVASIAAGLAGNLITRTADVCLKERRPLILVPRETPLNLIHLENLLKCARAGAIIVPAMPGFYHKPQSIDDLVEFQVMKVFDLLGLEYPFDCRWGPKSP